MQTRLLKLVLNKSQDPQQGAVMSNSNLAERRDEFAAAMSVIDPPIPKANAPRNHNPLQRSEKTGPRRLPVTARRIQIRDQGLRPFRVC